MYYVIKYGLAYRRAPVPNNLLRINNQEIVALLHMYDVYVHYDEYSAGLSVLC